MDLCLLYLYPIVLVVLLYLCHQITFLEVQRSGPIYS